MKTKTIFLFSLLCAIYLPVNAQQPKPQTVSWDMLKSVKEGHHDLKRVRTDRYIQVKGIFSINRDDPEHLMYLLKDAELVKVVR